MSKFTANVTLFDASVSDYVQLRETLGKKLYVAARSKQDEASFVRTGNVGIQEVTDDILRAATQTGRRYSFTIIRNKPLTEKEYRHV